MAISDADIRRIITDPNGAELLVEKSNELALDLKDKRMTTSQIRALFGEVRQIEAEWDMDKKQEAFRRLILLKPKMAYRARKEGGRSGDAVKMLVNVLDKALDQVARSDPANRDNNFRRFVEFFEAILAYHKAHGGN